MEEAKRRGRPPKSAAKAIVPETTTESARKYPRNPDPDMIRIINLVKDAIKHDQEPIGSGDFLGATYAERYGYYRHAMKLIAEELGV